MSLHAAQLELATERLLLRPLAVTDAPALFKVYGDTETMAFWSEQPAATVGETAKMIRADLDLVSRGVAAFWAVTLRDSGVAIGKLTLMHYSPQNQRAEIGYILHREHWRQGLMSEALTAAIDFAFGPLGLHRLEADTDTENLASIALLKKLYFREEGLFRQRWRVYGAWQDSLMFGLLSSDWQARSGA